jgi:hypothetical protein
MRRGGIVAKSLICILSIISFSLVGCHNPNAHKTKATTENQKPDTRAVLIEQLKSEKLPTLQSVETWENKYGPGLRLSTAHYQIFTTVLEPLMLRRIPGFVESAYRSYNSQLPEHVELSSKSTIYLFAERKQWEDHTRTFASNQAELLCKIEEGAYYLNGACVAYDIGRQSTFSALGHEGWHQFNGRLFTFRLPSWLDEGVAMLFEAGRYKAGIFHFEPHRNRYRLAVLAKTIEENKLIPLEELVAMNPGDVLATDETEALAAFYAQSYALIRFLRESGYGARLSDYRRLLWDGLNGHWPLSEGNQKIAADRNIPRTDEWNRAVGPELFRLYVSSDFQRIEREYLAFCRKITEE